MATLPHTNPENGYSLRIGKYVPKNAANLAYVHTDTPSPEKNLLLYDYSNAIQENNILSGEAEKFHAFAGIDGRLENEAGLLTVSRPDVLVTDEYTLGENPRPLYYQATSRFLFDARNALLAVPLSASRATTGKRFELYGAEDGYAFIYLGDKIRVTGSNGMALTNEDAYKIMLVKEGNDNFTYRIVLYANFQNGTAGYEMHYPAFQAGQNQSRTEILNPTPLFKEYMGEEGVIGKYYAIENNADAGYSIRILDYSSDSIMIGPKEREPYRFSYQIEAAVQARLSDRNAATVRIGLIYINETVYNAVKVTTALKKLVHNNPLMPDYLTFENPHNLSGYNEKSDSTYWLADLEMPREHYLDYDILIISGYGQKDFTRAADSMRAFLDTGGTLLFDNCGTGTSVLNPFNQNGMQTFIANIAFSSTLAANGVRSLTSDAVMKDRFFEIQDVSMMGTAVRPVIESSGQENFDEDWTTYIRHQNGGPSFLKKDTGSIGKLFVSNMGLMLDVLYNQEVSLKFLTNWLLYICENRSFISPIFKEQLHHRENLFAVEYSDAFGNLLYVDDRNDEDETQIIAKKILAENTAEHFRPYLPEAYRQFQSAHFKTHVLANESVSLVNPGMEEPSEDGTNSWTTTTENALPGYDFVVFSGANALAEQTKTLYKEGKHSLKIRTTDSQAFWEQDLGTLPAGTYTAEVCIRAEAANGGGYSIHYSDGSLLAQTSPLLGTTNWTNVPLVFELTDTADLFIRMGATIAPATTTLYFDDLRIRMDGMVRMTPANTGEETFYAYAIAPKGKNYALALLDNVDNVDELLKVDTVAEATLIVKSFVYKWNSSYGLFQKEYGNQKDTRFVVKQSEGNKVLGNLISLVPGLKYGTEWSNKERVYYELSLLPNNEWNDYLELSLYDPRIQQFFFTPRGEWVINHEDLWSDGYTSTTQVRVLNKATTLQTGKSGYAVKLKEENQIRVLEPASRDERERWYLRVQNGSFQKNAITAKDSLALAEAGRADFYDSFLSGQHNYRLPEYDRQTFYPVRGQRLIDGEQAEYIDERTIRVQRTPLIIEEEVVVKEPLTRLDATGLLWGARHILWNKEAPIAVYQDEFSDGNEILLNSGYVVDYDEGLVRFESVYEGAILASYSHDNFRITKRKYANSRIAKEATTTGDRHTFVSKHQNWAVQPAPRVTLGSRSNPSFVHPKEYVIDFESGTVHFPTPVSENVFVDYSFYKEETIVYADANRFTGEIKLKNRISFKDELYVSYLAEENTVEYKGYYDEESQTFLHLDLNPTAGHTFTQRETQAGVVKMIETASEKLLGKVIYLYLLPNRSVYYTKERSNEHCLRHVFGEEQWLLTKASQPEALLLAKLQVRENTAITQAVVLDARASGGGLKENIRQETIEQKIGYTSAFWDIGSFDGLAYYQNGVTVIRLPEKILRVNGGLFEEEEIRERLDKYLAYGVYPIIEYTS